MPPLYLKKAQALHSRRPKPVVPAASSVETFAAGVDGSTPIEVIYEVAIMSGGDAANPQGSSRAFTEMIPPAAFATKEGEGQVISALIQKYERGVFESQPWICSGSECEKQAVSFASYHMSAMRSTPASARTIAFPVHEMGGDCHKQAEAVWAETQASLARQAGITTTEIDTDELPALEGPVIDVNGGDGNKFDGVD